MDRHYRFLPEGRFPAADPWQLLLALLAVNVIGRFTLDLE